MLQTYKLDIDKDMLWSIYNRCIQSYDYYDKKVAKTTNVFITNTDDIEYLKKYILYPLGIDEKITHNQYNGGAAYRDTGFCFNVIRPNGFVNPHRDVNPSKLNILLNETTQSPFCFTESGDEYYYEAPVLLDVSQLHTVNNCELITEDRVTLQVFLTKDYKYCERMINENRRY
jgi:hypothetical protein